MTDKHDYGEPWRVLDNGMLVDRDEVYVSDFYYEQSSDERAAACVNALQGERDPAAFKALADKRAKALRELIEASTPALILMRLYGEECWCGFAEFQSALAAAKEVVE